MPKKDLERKRIATRLRLARERAGLTQGQVAKLLGLHRPSVSEIEAGRRRVSAEELAQMAKTYAVSVSWLTGSDVDSADEQQDRIQLAARELEKLKPQDLDKLLDLLSSLKRREQGGK